MEQGQQYGPNTKSTSCKLLPSPIKVEIICIILKGTVAKTAKGCDFYTSEREWKMVVFGTKNLDTTYTKDEFSYV